jgi:hypothetical protein
MKKIVIILAAIVTFASCESNNKFLEETPNGSLFPENFLNNGTEIQMMLNSLYNLWDTSMNRPYQSMEIKYASADDVLGTGNQRACYNEMEINMDISSGGDDDIQSGWERCYDVINQANSIINNYHNADGTMTEAELNALVGQAYFIRAFTYFWMVRFFNNIPLITTAFESDKTVQCAKAADIYKLIISDLQFAEEWLPVSYSNTTYKVGGAVTKGAAKSTLAKVYLQMAGYPVNGGTEYYALARDKAKEVIDNAATYGYALKTHFYELWDPYWTAFEKSSQEEAIIWFEHTLNNYTVRAPNPSRPIEFGGWESMIAENGFYNRFPAGERKDFTFVTDFYVMGGKHYTTNDLKSKHPSYRKWWADDLSEGWTWDEKGPSGLWLTNMETTATWYSTRPIVVMRYADILLTYAEAKARTDGPDALAYQCLNDVRNRAYKGLGTTEASVSNLTTDEFIDDVVWERAFEFAGFEYSARWFDLQRLQLVEKANTDWRDETESKYTLQKSYSKADYFLPIPSKEVINNPNLANNNADIK